MRRAAEPAPARLPLALLPPRLPSAATASSLSQPPSSAGSRASTPPACSVNALAKAAPLLIALLLLSLTLLLLLLPSPPPRLLLWPKKPLPKRKPFAWEEEGEGEEGVRVEEALGCRRKR